MTLFRQIAIATSVLVVSLLAVTMYSNYQTNVSFIEDRLYTSAKNTASSLGLAISRSSDGKDSAMAETMINAVFDSGLYEAIILTDIDGNVMYQRRIPMTIGDVPEWFSVLMNLPPAVAEVPVGREWMIVGDLRIEGHRGNAYLQMWNALKKVLLSFIALSAAAMLGIYFMLKIVLSSLKKVQEQAEAVSGNRFIIQKELPHTTEFRNVVAAMNSLIAKVKDIYKQEAEAISRYNALLYEDQQTHLKNRDFFMVKLGSILQAEDRFSEGFVLVYQIKDPDAIKNESGAYALQKQISHVSDSAKSTVTRVREGFACRVRENDIMLILPTVGEMEMTQLLNEAAGDCEASACSVSIAAVAYRYGESVSEVLSHVDFALMQAASKTDDTPVVYRPERTDVPAWGHDEWRRRLIAAMQDDSFVALYQPIVDRRGNTIQKELLLRLNLDGKLMNAGVFIPVVLHLDLENELDRYVLEKVGRESHTSEIAVNVSLAFIRQSSTIRWLMSLVNGWKAAAVKVAFELPNSSVLSDLETTETFANFVQKLGYRFGIDHFVIDSDDLQYLQKVKPSYLKINAAYLLTLVDAQRDTGRTPALFTISKLLDIDLIATDVDSKETAEKLYEQGIVMLQGFWVGKPTEEQHIDA